MLSRSLLTLSFAVLLAPASPADDPCRYSPADDETRLPCEARAAEPVAAPDDASLRIVTFNVHYGKNVDRIARAIRGHDALGGADVILLQEIESYPGDRRAEALAEKLGMHLVYAPARPKGHGTHGLAILSRYALRDLEVVLLPHFELGWGTHRRVAQIATLDWNGVDVRIANVHLDTRLTLKQRYEQIGPVLERLEDGPRAIIAGDVNTISCLSALLPGVPICLPGLSQGPDFDRFMKTQGFVAPFQRIGGTGPLHQRLDAIFVRGLAVDAFDKEDGVRVSDHLPLWADLSLPAAAGMGGLLAPPMAITLPYRPTY